MMWFKEAELQNLENQITAVGAPSDGPHVALLIGGLLVGQELELFKSTVNMLVKPQVEAGCKVDIFFVLRIIDKKWDRPVGFTDCMEGDGIAVEDPGPGKKLPECKALCEKHDRCTSMGWAPGDGHCVLYSSCEHPKESSGWHRHTLKRPGPRNASDIHEFRAVAEKAGARIVVLHLLDESKFLIDAMHLTGKYKIELNQRSSDSTEKIVLQNRMIKTKLQRAEAYEKKHNLRYDWFIHARSDTIWLEKAPSIRDFDPDRIHGPNFGHYGGLNDRFAVVPRRHRQSYFADRYNRWLSGDYQWDCLGYCPCEDSGMCRRKCEAKEMKHNHNNECLLHSMLQGPGQKSLIRFKRHPFQVAKVAQSLYANELCTMHWDECFKFGKNMCRCLIHRCKNDEIRHGAWVAQPKSAEQDALLSGRELTPKQYDECHAILHGYVEKKQFPWAG